MFKSEQKEVGGGASPLIFLSETLTENRTVNTDPFNKLECYRKVCLLQELYHQVKQDID